MMLEHVESRLAKQRESVAAIQSKLATTRFANGQRARLSRYLTAAQGVTTKPLRVSIVGELNSGKTELANLILGVQLLPTSVINNTLCPTIVRYGEAQAVRRYRDETLFEETGSSDLHRLVQRDGYRVECDLPLPLLRSVEIADLPSFGTISLTASRICSQLWRSDMIIWCSRATRAWTASEREIWLQLPKRLRTNCLFVLTHADKLHEVALASVVERLNTEIPAEAGAQPVTLATPQAIAARSPRGQIMNPKLWTASGGERFFKKLSDLLQNALGNRQSRIEKNTNRILASVLGDPTDGDGGAVTREWMLLQRFFTVRPDDAAPEQTTAAAAEAMVLFKRNVLEPWLRLHNWREKEIATVLKLLPDTPDALGATSKRRLAERLPLIFEQIKAEIEECRSRAA